MRVTSQRNGSTYDAVVKADGRVLCRISDTIVDIGSIHKTDGCWLSAFRNGSSILHLQRKSAVRALLDRHLYKVW